MRPPNEAVSYEQALQVYNEDLAGLSRSELYAEISRVARNAARNPWAMVFRGPTFISNRHYAEERIAACLELLKEPARRRRQKPKAWVP